MVEFPKPTFPYDYDPNTQINALRHYLGESQLNAILAEFLERFGFSGPPYPTSLSLVEMILDRYGVDVLDIGRAFNDRDQDWYDVTLPQGIPVQFPSWFRSTEQYHQQLHEYDEQTYLQAKQKEHINQLNLQLQADRKSVQ